MTTRFFKMADAARVINEYTEAWRETPNEQTALQFAYAYCTLARFGVGGQAYRNIYAVFNEDIDKIALMLVGTPLGSLRSVRELIETINGSNHDAIVARLVDLDARVCALAILEAAGSENPAENYVRAAFCVVAHAAKLGKLAFLREQAVEMMSNSIPPLRWLEMSERIYEFIATN